MDQAYARVLYTHQLCRIDFMQRFSVGTAPCQAWAPKLVSSCSNYCTPAGHAAASSKPRQRRCSIQRRQTLQPGSKYHRPVCLARAAARAGRLASTVAAAQPQAATSSSSPASSSNASNMESGAGSTSSPDSLANGGLSGSSTATLAGPSPSSSADTLQPGNTSSSSTAVHTNGSSSSSSSSNSSRSSNSNSNSTAGSAKALLQSVMYSTTHTLPPEPDWQSAVAALHKAVEATYQQLSQTLAKTTSSGVVRWEVPLPRAAPAAQGSAGFTALQWLQGQEGLRRTLHQVYFSGRHSTAPDTPGTAAAEAAAEGWGAVAGLGAAWLWQGQACQGFDSGVMAGLQRFLSEAQPRLRILGGSRQVLLVNVFKFKT